MRVCSSGISYNRGLYCLLALNAIGLFDLSARAATETVLYNFEAPPRGANPYGGVTLGPGGALYGTASIGGTSGAGIVYKVGPAGRQTILYNFTGGIDGGNPQAGVVFDPSGNLYGTATEGGVSGGGVVFRLSPTGEETVLYNFAFGNRPSSGLVRDSDGNLYGTGFTGLLPGCVYKIDSGGNETTLYTFKGVPDGINAAGGLILDQSGNLYGTAAGGSFDAGVIFKITPGGVEKVLYNFTGGADGRNPNGPLVRDASGNLYGTTQNGGASNWGTVFKLDKAGHETVLYSFTGGADGGTPTAGVIRDSDGNLYGTNDIAGASAPICAEIGCGLVFKLDSTGHETVLYSFSNGPYMYPGVSKLIRDSAGNLYGTIHDGGPTGEGGVFKVDSSGKGTILYAFPGGDGVDPGANLTRTPSGTILGTTVFGGEWNAGTVFMISPRGKETVLHHFTGGADGGLPQGSVIQDAEGNIYGTASQGGGFGQGVVFKIDPSGKESVLHDFNGLDGAAPVSGVTRDSEGNLYGTTFFGGTTGGSGVVYQLDPSGNETVLYSFSGPDGANPTSGVVRDSAGNLYGTTSRGGPAGTGSGVVYKLDKSGKQSILLGFAPSDSVAQQTSGVIRDSEGNLYGTDVAHDEVYKIDKSGKVTVLATLTYQSSSLSGVVRDAAGNLYGTSYYGSQTCQLFPCGVVFKVDPEGNPSTLYSFTGGADGGSPPAGVILDSAGNLYGTTYNGGSEGRGVVFKLTP